MSRLGDWLQRVRELNHQGERGLFSWPGCVSLLGVCVSFAAVLMNVNFTMARNTEGLVLVIVILLACILMVVSTKAT